MTMNHQSIATILRNPLISISDAGFKICQEADIFGRTTKPGRRARKVRVLVTSAPNAVLLEDIIGKSDFARKEKCRKEKYRK